MKHSVNAIARLAAAILAAGSCATSRAWEAPTPVTDPRLPQDADEAYFRETLAPYGEWQNAPEYGAVWQPLEARCTSTWRPYCHGGQWVWTDDGWYWRSAYPWGWMPFHYGRWVCAPAHGWVWVPGAVWAPAWVHWRSAPSCIGWAPLPPGSGYSTSCGLAYQGRNVGSDFHFGLSDNDYVFVPPAQLSACQVPSTMFSFSYARSAYRQSCVVPYVPQAPCLSGGPRLPPPPFPRCATVAPPSQPGPPRCVTVVPPPTPAPLHPGRRSVNVLRSNGLLSPAVSASPPAAPQTAPALRGNPSSASPAAGAPRRSTAVLPRGPAATPRPSASPASPTSRPVFGPAPGFGAAAFAARTPARSGDSHASRVLTVRQAHLGR